MLQIFRSNSPLLTIVLLVYLIVLRLHNFIFPTDWQPTNPNFFSEIMYDWVGTNGFWPNVVAVLLILLQAIMLNFTVMNYKMQRTATYLPAVAYVLFTSAVPEFLELHPLHFANTFFIIALYQLFKSYRKYDPSSELFNIGFCIAVGSMFYFSMNTFIFFAIMGLLVIRSFNLKEFLVIFIGFVVPFFLVGTYLYWIDSFELFRDLWANFYFFDFNFSSQPGSYLQFGLILFILLLSLINFQSFFYKTNIQIQKYVSMLYWAVLVAMLSFVYQGQITIGHFLILAPTLSIFLAFSLLKIKNKAVAEFLHLTLLIIVLILQYRELLIAALIQQ